MKLTKILMSGAAVLTPAVVLPLVNAAKVDNSTKVAQNINNKAASNELITVGSDGWVWMDSNKTARYHLTFSETTKTCYIDKMTVNTSENDAFTFQPQAEYKFVGYPQVDAFQLTKIKVWNGCSGSGFLGCLDLSQAKYLEEICEHCFDTGDDGNCDFHINWVNFSGATNLTTIGYCAFWNQFFKRTSDDQDLDFSSTKLKTIGASAFRGCCKSGDGWERNSRSIIFPSTLESIGEYAFESYRGRNNFAPRKVVFLGNDAPSIGNGGALPAVAASVSEQTCVIVPAGKKEEYWNKWTLAHSPLNYELGQAIKQSNLIESTIKFNTSESDPGVGHKTQYKQAGLSGQDDKTWCPVNVSDGSLCITNNMWLADDANGKIHLTKESTGQVRLSWDADLPAGVYTIDILASTGSGSDMCVTATQCKLTMSEVTLTGGSDIVRASYVAGKDSKVWTPYLSHSSVQLSTTALSGTIQAPDSIKDKLELYTEQVGSVPVLRLTWKDDLTAGQYDIKIIANITDLYGSTYKYYVPVKFYVAETYYGLSIDSDSTTTSSTPVTDVTLVNNGTDAERTKTLYVKMYEGNSVTQSDLATPQLSISSREGISIQQLSGATGVYKIDIDVEKWTLGTYEFYAWSWTKLEVEGTEINYPVYSNVVTIKVVSNSITTVTTCTGGSGDLTAYNNQSGADSATWTVSDYELAKGTIGEIKFNKAAWSKFDAQRLGHIKAVVDSNTFKIQWDSTFSAMTSWWEIVDFDAEFDVTYTTSTNDTVIQHVVLPLSVSIRNKGEIKSEIGQTIYDCPQSTYQVEQPWQMFSNGSKEPVSSIVYYYLDDEELTQIGAKGKISMEVHEGEANQAYLTYHDLPIGTYSFTIYAYDTENVVTAQQSVTIVIDNYAAISGVPSSLSITKGDGKYSTQLSVKLNGEDWKGNVKYSIPDFAQDTLWVDDNGYICWSSKLETGIYDLVTIYATITLEDDVTTVTSVPAQLKLTVNPASSGSNVGAIVGGTVGGVVGAGGLATGGYFGVKKYKAVKGKKK